LLPFFHVTVALFSLFSIDMSFLQIFQQMDVDMIDLIAILLAIVVSLKALIPKKIKQTKAPVLNMPISSYPDSHTWSVQSPREAKHSYLTKDEPLQGFTTVKVKVRQNTTPSDLKEMLDLKYTDTYDFVKLPFDTQTQGFKQWGFINFVSKNAAKSFRRTCKLQTNWAGNQGQQECLSTLNPKIANLPLGQQPIVMVDGKRANLRDLLANNQ